MLPKRSSKLDRTEERGSGGSGLSRSTRAGRWSGSGGWDGSESWNFRFSLGFGLSCGFGVVFGFGFGFGSDFGFLSVLDSAFNSNRFPGCGIVSVLELDSVVLVIDFVFVSDSVLVYFFFRFRIHFGFFLVSIPAQVRLWIPFHF